MGVFLCPFNLDLFPRLPYNVAMNDKELKIKVDDQFIEKVDYLKRINDYKNRSDTVRKVVEKEYAKNVECDVRFFEFLVNKMDPNELEKYRTMYESKGEKTDVR